MANGQQQSCQWKESGQRKDRMKVKIIFEDSERSYDSLTAIKHQSSVQLQAGKRLVMMDVNINVSQLKRSAFRRHEKIQEDTINREKKNNLWAKQLFFFFFFTQ